MASERNTSKKEVEFSWTVDELQLLLQAPLDCKPKFEFNAENWVTKRQKYEAITLGSHYQMTTRIRFHPLVLALYSILQMRKIFQMKKKVTKFRTNRTQSKA